MRVLTTEGLYFIHAIRTVRLPVTDPSDRDTLAAIAATELIHGTGKLRPQAVLFIRAIQAVSLTIALPRFLVTVAGLGTFELIGGTLGFGAATLVTAVHALVDAITTEVAQDAATIVTREFAHGAVAWRAVDLV